MNGRTLSQNPRKRGKSHHHHYTSPFVIYNVPCSSHQVCFAYNCEYSVLYDCHCIKGPMLYSALTHDSGTKKQQQQKTVAMGADRI